MASRLYLIVLIFATRFVDMMLLPEQPFANVQAQINPNKLEADREISLGNQQKQNNQYREALNSYQSALEIYRDLGDLKGQGISLDELGNTYKSLGQYQQAIDAFYGSIEIARQIGNRKGESASLNNLGIVYYLQGKFEMATESFQTSLALKKPTEDLSSEVSSLNNLGATYNALGKYERAIDSFQQSLAITKQSGDIHREQFSFNNLGITYSMLGKYQEALDYYLQSLAISKRFKDLQGQSSSLYNLGVTYLSLGKYATALDYYQQSLSIFRQIGDRNGEVSAFLGFGNAYKDLKQYEKAIGFYQQSLKISDLLGDLKGKEDSLNNLGIAYNKLGQYDKSIESYHNSLAIARQIGDRDGVGGTLNNLGFLFKEQNQPEIAIFFYKEAVNAHEAIRRDNRNLKKDYQSSYLETISRSYKNLAELLLERNRITEALQVLDLLKIQELDDYLKNIKGNDRTSHGVRLLEPEKAISSQLLAMSDRQIPELNRQLANQIQQLPKSEINKPPEYLQKLSKGSILIYPLILSDRLELIVFSANTIPINHTVPIKKADLEKLIDDFRSDLQDPNSLDVKDSSSNLYNVLIKPIEADLRQANASTILYAPDGLLRYIPLAALYDGKQWLVEKYRINNLIAYSLFDPDSKPQANIHIFAGAFGGVGGKTRFGFGGLPSTIPEVNNIAANFANTTMLIGQKFTANATKAEVVGQTIIHFATHAEFKLGSPIDSYILFGDGSKVTLAEIDDWQLKDVDLVVLSACQTGVGILGTGSEILGFGYQVQKAGAKASIASLWTVSDGGTQLLMQAFYESLRKGNPSLSTSLRDAQLSMIHRPVKDDEPNFNHPYFWSAFVLIGNGL